MRGVLRDPDIVSQVDFVKCIYMVELIGNASIYAHSTISEDVRAVVLDAFARVQLKLMHSYKVSRLTKEYFFLLSDQEKE